MPFLSWLWNNCSFGRLFIRLLCYMDYCKDYISWMHHWTELLTIMTTSGTASFQLEFQLTNDRVTHSISQFVDNFLTSTVWIFVFAFYERKFTKGSAGKYILKKRLVICYVSFLLAMKARPSISWKRSSTWPHGVRVTNLEPRLLPRQ